ncbi:unnamed protein product [Lactuca virosa]|uniref:Uncharacterized protein n=1 Tax=Lactuca virosa TaxID=75947 RepID=A0AAU9PH37_9ASTR|nr:unnamed protein product [Lactuca virosa]
MLGFISGEFFHYTAKQEGGDSYRLWRRSDAVVKGWILGSLSEEALCYVLYCLKENIHRTVDADFDAKSLWDELGSIYNPQRLVDLPDPKETRIEEAHKNLHRATLDGDWDKVDSILKTGYVTLFSEITNNGNTALHVAASNTKKPKLLQKMLETIQDTPTQLHYQINSEGSTPLHVAAIVGNTEAAKILVTRNTDLLFTSDYRNQTPLAIALCNMDTKMSEILLHFSKTDNMNDTQFSDRSGDELLAILISSKDFRLALNLVERYQTFKDDAVLMAIAQNFPKELNILEKYIGTSIMGNRVKEALNSVQDGMVERCVPFCGSWVETLFWLFFVVWPLIRKRVRVYGEAMQLLSKDRMHIRL